MNNLYRHILKYICTRLVVQGPNHHANIEEYFRILHTAARKEFREESPRTLDYYLAEVHMEALKNPDHVEMEKFIKNLHKM